MVAATTPTRDETSFDGADVDDDDVLQRRWSARRRRRVEPAAAWGSSPIRGVERVGIAFSLEQKSFRRGEVLLKQRGSLGHLIIQYGEDFGLLG